MNEESEFIDHFLPEESQGRSTGLWKGLIWLAKFILGTLSYFLLLIIHRHFGERYLNPLVFLIALLVTTSYFVSLQVGNNFIKMAQIVEEQSSKDKRATPQINQFLLQPPTEFSDEAKMEMAKVALRGLIETITFFFAIIGLYIWHCVAMLRRNYRGLLCHSRYNGDSYIFPFYIRPVRALFGNLYYWRWFGEPLICWFLGMTIMLLSMPFGVLIANSAIFLFIANTVVFFQYRGRMLDALDRQIEGKQFAQDLNAWKEPGSSNTQGVVIPPFVVEFAKTFEVSGRGNVAITDLHSDLKSLMDGEGPSSSSTGSRPSPQHSSVSSPIKNDIYKPINWGEIRFRRLFLIILSIVIILFMIFSFKLINSRSRNDGVEKIPRDVSSAFNSKLPDPSPTPELTQTDIKPFGFQVPSNNPLLTQTPNPLPTLAPTDLPTITPLPTASQRLLDRIDETGKLAEKITETFKSKSLNPDADEDFKAGKNALSLAHDHIADNEFDQAEEALDQAMVKLATAASNAAEAW